LRFIERFIGAIFSVISQFLGVGRVKLPSKYHFLAPVWEIMYGRILVKQRQMMLQRQSLELGIDTSIAITFGSGNSSGS
jgi:hypothetical protein